MTAALIIPGGHVSASGCPCECHSNGAYPPPCNIDGGCHRLHTKCAAGGKPHPATTKGDHPEPTGHLLCEHHFDALGKLLRDIEREAQPVQVTDESVMLNLDPRPSMQIVWNQAAGGAPAFEQTPVRLDPIVHTDLRRGTGHIWLPEDKADPTAWDDTPSILETLHAWARQVRTDPERKLSIPTVTVILGRGPRPAPPAGPACDHLCSHESCGAIRPPCNRLCGHESCGPWVTDTVRALPTVAGERELLTRQLDWIARQPWVADMYDELRSLRERLQRSNQTAAEQPHGRCPTEVGGGECGGPLWPVKPKHTAGEDVWTGSSPSAVQCERCGQRWDGPPAMARLAITLGQRRAR